MIAGSLTLVLLGDPVAHSRSPALHQAALAAVGIAGTYQARQVDEAGMEGALAELRRGELHGANVTMPHKRLAARLADRRHPLAERARAVNTLVATGGSVTGYLTDVAGVRYAWERAGLPDTVALVLGAGGAAAAALLAVEGRPLAVAARDRGRAVRLVDQLEVAASVLGWGEALPGAVVVNATPLGMGGETLPPQLLEGATGLLDMTYGADLTPAVRDARAAGVPVADGHDMLLGQAMASFELWTGMAAPEEAMRRALGA